MAAPWQWFTQAFWRNRGPDQRAVLDQWQRLGQLPLVVQDIALRGGVFSPAHRDPPAPPVTETEILIHEGRRQLALEIIKHAGLDAASVWRSIAEAQINRPENPSAKRR
ncbi:MAG: hypothetical protein J0L51_00035 [Rhizobiales bacterium]|nr:hypothetical protein [Hyphomicrobiales bacterium]